MLFVRTKIFIHRFNSHSFCVISKFHWYYLSNYIMEMDRCQSFEIIILLSTETQKNHDEMLTNDANCSQLRWLFFIYFASLRVNFPSSNRPSFRWILGRFHPEMDDVSIGLRWVCSACLNFRLYCIFFNELKSREESLFISSLNRAATLWLMAAILGVYIHVRGWKRCAFFMLKAGRGSNIAHGL